MRTAQRPLESDLEDALPHLAPAAIAALWMSTTWLEKQEAIAGTCEDLAGSETEQALDLFRLAGEQQSNLAPTFSAAGLDVMKHLEHAL